MKPTLGRTLPSQSNEPVSDFVIGIQFFEFVSDFDIRISYCLEE